MRGGWRSLSWGASGVVGFAVDDAEGGGVGPAWVHVGSPFWGDMVGFRSGSVCGVHGVLLRCVAQVMHRFLFLYWSLPVLHFGQTQGFLVIVRPPFCRSIFIVLS